MHAVTVKALELATPLFKYGVPHFRQREIIPIRTPSHFIAFDVEKISPLYTMLSLTEQSSQKNVGRKDNFVSDHTLPDELRTTEEDYREWNRLNRETPVDKGHSAGSQYRRSDSLQQSSIDNLAGCCPEAPAMNRGPKKDIENAIYKEAGHWSQVFLVQGPLWYGMRPGWGKLRNGQWIPDGIFISSLWLKGKQCESHSWMMENVWDKDHVRPRPVSLDKLEDVSGLHLWGAVQTSEFVNSRSAATNWKPF